MTGCAEETAACSLTFSCWTLSGRVLADATVWVCLTLRQVALKLRRLVHICHLDRQDLQVCDTNIILHINLQIEYFGPCFEI